ncbi:MAG: glycosyltransferase [bacterium]
MKILHLSTWETGGAAIAATRLSNTLNDMGATSEVLHMSSRLPAYLDAAIGKLAHFTNPIFHSYNYFGQNISSKINIFKPDIIHIHWIGAGFVTPESLAKLNLPIVWTLHDLWPLCGAEHLPGSNRFKAGYLKSNRPTGEKGVDLDLLVWQRKIKAFKDLNITYVAPSHYLTEQAQSALALGDHRLVYLQNGIDSEIFAPARSAIRKPVILFVAMNPELDLNKGYSDFLAAVDLLSISLRLAHKIKVIGGQITSPEMMAKEYQSATITVVASKIENLPYVVMESMACGAPVVAYNVGGIPDLIDHKISGYLARPGDVKDLARGMELLLSSPKLLAEYAKVGHAKITKNFEMKNVAKKYLSLYQELI